jgi:UDP-N-acetyl-2-amino-2-deoxyglucuronate dehydrogenase
MSKNFALIGASGYVAPRHLKAIYETGNRLVAAFDPNDSAGVMDQYFIDAKFFTEHNRFERFLEKQKREATEEKVNYISICSPNYLHDMHCRLSLRVGATAICEKPLVINPWNLDALQEAESEYSGKIYTILQLRHHPKMIELHRKIQEAGNGRRRVILTYVTSRGPWYDVSWKGSVEKSGGIAVNIGIHLFDLMLWMFGPMNDCRVYHSDHRRMSGFLDLECADVTWYLSVDKDDLPFQMVTGTRSSYRSMNMDGEEIEFSEGFGDLHTIVYQEILAGRGLGIEDARPSINLAYRLRNTLLSSPDKQVHPYLKNR